MTPGHVWTQSGNTYSVGVLSGANTYSTTAPSGAAASHVFTNFESAADAAGNPIVRSVESIPMAGAKSIPVIVSNPVSKAEAAAAIGRFAGKLNLALTIGMGLYDLAHDLGYTFRWDAANGVNVPQQMNTTTTFDDVSLLGGSCSPWQRSDFTSAAGACSQGAADNITCANSTQTGTTYTLVSSSLSGSTCSITYQAKSSTTGQIYGNGTTSGQIGSQTTQSNTDVPLSQLTNAVQAQGTWTDHSQVALRDSLSSGEQVVTGSPTTSGPATVQGPTTTTTQSGVDPVTGKQGNATTTTNSFWSPTYNNSTVTVNQTDQSTTNWTFTDNTTRTSNSTTTAAPTKPDDPCTATPDALGCLKLGDPSTGTDTLDKQSKAISVTPVSFSGGTCPPPVGFTAFNRSYAFSYSPLCDKLAYVAPILAALAAFAAAWILADSFKVS